MDVSVAGLCWDGLNGHAADLDLTRLVSSGPSGHDRAIEADRDHVWHPFSPMLEYLDEKPHPLMIVAGEGSHLVDSDGRSYIDGTGSLWVNIHGHRRPELDRAIREQLHRVAHTTLLGLANEPSALLAAELARITPDGLDRVFFSDNGSTAVEVALKVAFQYWRQSGRPEKKEFVSFVNAYHGDTIGAVSVGGHDMFHTIFEPLLFQAHLAPAAYCYRCPVGLTYPGCGLACLDGLEAILAERAGSVAAVIVEPLVQGAAGILVQPPGYLGRIARLCREYDVLLIADEVATGFGRTGRLFACEQENVRPDIMALAKGITGGYLPLAATLFREEIYEAFLGRFEEFRTFFHGHTYTGNPLACAAALANIELLTQPEFINALEQKTALLDSFLKPLDNLKHVGDIRQLGLMAGIELVADRRSGEPFPVEARIARRVILKAREQGVIIRPLGDTVVLVPPLAIDADDLRRLVDATAWAITEVTEHDNG
ncbi:MAG: adenosylmethionine--8-amino-7-oxononanoate transaminase [Thermoleophilia bacterium]